MANGDKTGLRSRSNPGMELFEITPIVLGGDPIDAKNKTWLTRQQHFEAVRYWNRVISDLRARGDRDSNSRNEDALA